METYSPQGAAASGALQTARVPLRAAPSKTDLILAGAYALALVAFALATPLQLPELLGIGWSVHFTWAQFWSWTAQSTDPTLLGNLIQLPFVHFFGPSRLGTRLPGVLLAAFSALLFLRLSRRAVPKQRYVALFLFLLLPLQLVALTSSLQFQAATCFLLLAMLAFFRLVSGPGFKTAILLALATTACLFTDAHAGLPVFGAVLCLLRFSPRPQERLALWFALGACVWAALAYVPYYIWASSQTSSHWISEPGILLVALPHLSAAQYAVAGALVVMLAGASMGAYASFRLPQSRLQRRMTLFCLAGSVFLTLVFMISVSLYFVTPIVPSDLLYAAPAAILLFVAGLNWLIKDTASGGLQRLTGAVAIVLMLAFAAEDFEFITAPKDNLALESRYVAPELVGNSCVVFVTEFFSRQMFFLFQPALEKRECEDFFHPRIVLASHSYVRPDQQTDAEGAFLGMNFQEVKRIRSGGGQIVVFESK